MHAAELKQLAADATAKQAAGDVSGALASWRSALDLLPDGTRQRAEIAARVEELSRSLSSGTPAAAGGGWKKLGGGAGAGAALLGLLGKGKFLLFGLTKLTTLGSMAVAFGLYLTLWSWKFALGFVFAIYVHEMGHVMALRRFGIAATAPMFIPGVGAIVRLKQNPGDRRRGRARRPGRAHLGLRRRHRRVHRRSRQRRAHLDGDRASGRPAQPVQPHAARPARRWPRLQRALAPAAPAHGRRARRRLGPHAQRHRHAFVLLVAVGRALSPRAPKEHDWTIASEYMVLVGALTWLAALPVPSGR